jgi:biopolymer transport protein ExbD
MKLSRTLEFNPALFTIVPLINVLVLVLLFFTLSSSFVFQPGISVVPPASSFLLGPQRNPQIVSVVSTPATNIYFRDQKMTMDQLASSLDEPGLADRTLVIKADRHTGYNVVMRIINLGLERGFSVVLAASQETAR